MIRAAVVAAVLAMAAGAHAGGAPVMTHLTGAAIPSVKALQDVDDAVGWTDASGPMAAVFSSKEAPTDGGDGNGKSRHLQVDLVALAGGKPKVLRSVRDQVDVCEEDLTLELIGGSIEVTDLDGDGIGELTFAYRISCKGDVSPDEIKLLVLEGGDKYILRGDDRFELDGRRKGGAFKPDPSAAKWPKGFLAHATAAWKKIVR